MSNNSSNNSNSGVGFVGLLQLTFIILKLVGIINWNWFWVLSPIWITVIFYVLVIVIIFKFLK